MAFTRQQNIEYMRRRVVEIRALADKSEAAGLIDTAMELRKAAEQEDAIAVMMETNVAGECVIGSYCREHQGVHGVEAERLRKGIQRLIKEQPYDSRNIVPTYQLSGLLDRVDARDSLAYLEVKARGEA